LAAICTNASFNCYALLLLCFVICLLLFMIMGLKLKEPEAEVMMAVNNHI